MKPESNSTFRCPLVQARRELSILRRGAIISSILPFVLSVASILVVRHFDPRFLHNPILVCVLVLFVAGQALLLWQLWQLLARANSGISVLDIVKKSGEVPDLAALEAELSAAPPDPIRDIVLGWIHLDRSCEGEGAAELLRNSSDRRSLRDQMELSIHAMINRSVLKLGFLGTLLGLLLTFPPMKRAILGLSDSDGEMAFIRDIAKALDEDAYAIQATLVATGLSLALETMVVQLLDRFYSRFELVESLLSDWHITVVGHAKNRRKPDPAGAGEDNLRLQAKLAQGQQILDAHLQKLLESLRKTGDAVETVARSQAALESRVSEIVAWEKDYRNFVAAKEKAAAPALRRVEA